MAKKMEKKRENYQKFKVNTFFLFIIEVPKYLPKRIYIKFVKTFLNFIRNSELATSN